MFGHAIAHVPFEAIAGMGGPEAGHQPVARHLGDDRCRRDRGDEPVAADHGLAVATGIDAIAAIDEDQRGFTGSASTARASAHSEARRILSRSIRAVGAKATATCALAQILS